MSSHHKKIYNEKSLKESWYTGSTAWVVNGPDGIRYFAKRHNDDEPTPFTAATVEELFVKLTPFLFVTVKTEHRGNVIKPNKEYSVNAF